MTMHFSDVARQAMADGAISADEVLALRRAGWADGQISPEEAEAIFAINHRLDRPASEWAEFFIEAIGEYVVNQLEPRGYVTDEQGRWLISRIEQDDKLHSLTELELLVRVFEKAEDVPETLRAFAMEQIERAVLTGEGPTRCGGRLDKGNVTLAEARLLRRMLFSSGSDRPAGISRREAEMLFRIKDATLGANNDPEWKRLFVQGVGNYLQGFTGHTALSRERAVQLEAFKQAGPALDQLVEQARAVTSDEQAWLDAQVNADGQVDEYEEALLAFLAEA